MLAEAFTATRRTGERFYEPELQRLRGEWLLQGARDPARDTRTAARAEACLRRAIDTARRQGARSLELRALTSLCRLWQHQGQETRARQRLEELYGQFTEGADTPDLSAARALLAELSPAPSP